MSFKKQARARYAEVLAKIASQKQWGFAQPAQIEALQQEARKLAAVLFGAQAKAA